MKKFLSTFFFVMLMLVLIIIVIDFTEKNDDFLRNNVPMSLIGRYYLTFIPYMASLIMPITVFIATVFVTAKLAANTEIIAILASGVSFKRLMLPYLFGAIIIAIVSFYLNSYLIPDANKFRIQFEVAYVKRPFYYSDRNIHIKISQTGYIFMDRYNNQRDIGYQVTLESINDDEEMLQKIHAQRIQWDSTSQRWKLINWQRRDIKDLNETFENGKELDTLLNMSPADFANKERWWETLTLTELNNHIELQKSRGSEDVQVYEVEKYIRYMQPFTVIVLMFIGVIVSSKKSRRGTGFQIALGFLIAFIFIIFFIMARALAEANTMNPIFAVWIPNLVFSLVGIFMYNTVPR